MSRRSEHGSTPAAENSSTRAAGPDDAPGGRGRSSSSPRPPPPRLPFRHWFLVGGRGPPPTTAGFLRMARERREQGEAEREWRAARSQGPLGEGGRPKNLRRWHRERKGMEAGRDDGKTDDGEDGEENEDKGKKVVRRKDGAKKARESEEEGKDGEGEAAGQDW